MSGVGAHIPGPWLDWSTLEWLVEPQRLLAETADARLIASAPDLLRVLERVNHTLAVHGHVDCGTDLACAVSEVLAKATEA